MKNVFLYLYPIEEYAKTFLFRDDSLYDKWNIKRPLPILNECIQKRYRESGYQVVFVLYPDKELFGLTRCVEDRVIYTDILFSENSAIDDNNKDKIDFTPKYPNERKLIEQLGEVDHLVVGGYHFSDCVKRIAEWAINSGIDTIVDLDLTDLFFSVYQKENYFCIDEYNPKRYKQHVLDSASKLGECFAEKQFSTMYASPIYGFSDDESKKIK